MAWLAGWSYRKEITVSNASADYQTKILIGKTSDAIGADVDCGGHIADDFDDLRFTAADGTTLLDYWIESIVDSGGTKLATVWVQNNAGADTTLYMYYGGTEVAVSNGANTFLIFDHFDDESLDTGIWQGDTGNAVESGTTVLVMGTEAGFEAINSIIDFSGAHRLRSRSKMLSAGAQYTYLGFAEPGTLDDRAIFVGGAVNDIYVYDEGVQAVANYVEDESSFSTKEILWIAGTHAKFVDLGSLQATVETNVPDGVPNIPAYIGTYNSGVAIEIDWLFVSKYAVTEPSFAWGSEEIPGWTGKVSGITITSVMGIPAASIAEVKGVA